MLDAEFFPAPQQSSRRLMVMLHGLGDSSAGFHWMPGALALPDMNYLLVNAPDSYYGGFAWYDFTDPAKMFTGVERSRRLLFEFLDAQRARGFPTEQTILGGFSQGCLMTLEVGLHYPHRFAGLVGISGYMLAPEQSLKNLSPVARQQRFLVTHGHHDPILPFERTRHQINTLQAAGIQIEWHEFVKAHTIAGETELQVIRDFIKASYS